MADVVQSAVVAAADLIAKKREEDAAVTTAAAIEAQERNAARESLIAMTLYTMPSYRVNWHHKELAEQLEEVEQGRLKRLMVFMPPRQGKSELCSIRFPAFFLGRNPQKSVIGTSYAIDLARSFSGACRNVVMGEPYQCLWPMQLTKEGDTHWQVAGKADERNSFIAAGVGGGITGEGAHLLLVDDPFKNYQEALSQVTRDGVWNWFTSTARTRLAPNGAIIIIMTRWHEDDLAGRALRLAAEDPTADQWTVLELPATNDREFEAKLWRTDFTEVKKFPSYAALWADQYGPEFLAGTRATLGTVQYSALYGGSPKSASGNIIKREWFKHWYVMPGDPMPTDATGLRPGYAFESCVTLPAPEEFDSLAQSWDMAFKETKTSDFVSGGVWGKKSARKFLVDRRNERMDFPKTKQAVIQMTIKHPLAHSKWVEDKANGPAIIADLRDSISGLIPVEPLGSKEARLSAASPDAEAGNIILPHPSIAPWVYDFIECLCMFPNGLHDDDVDMFSQAIVKMRTSGEGLLGLWRQQAEELRAKQAAVKVDRSIQTAEEKREGGFERMQPVKTLGKVATSTQQQPGCTSECPGCKNKLLARGSEGYWKCNGCGISGRDGVGLYRQTEVMEHTGGRG